MEMWNGTATMENSVAFPKKLKIELPYDPTILVLSVYPKEVKQGFKSHLNTHVRSTYTQ